MYKRQARHKTHRALVSETLARIIQRADELAEFVAIYWKDGRVPLSGQVKKGLATAFPKFDEYLSLIHICLSVEGKGSS